MHLQNIPAGSKSWGIYPSTPTSHWTRAAPSCLSYRYSHGCWQVTGVRRMGQGPRPGRLQGRKVSVDLESDRPAFKKILSLLTKTKTLGKLFSLSAPQISHLWNGENHTTHSIRDALRIVWTNVKYEAHHQHIESASTFLPFSLFHTSLLIDCLYSTSSYTEVQSNLYRGIKQTSAPSSAFARVPIYRSHSGTLRYSCRMYEGSRA